MKLGTKLIVSLVLIVIVTMTIHGYLSIQQDEEAVEREIRVGMRGMTRAVQATLEHFYGDLRDIEGLRKFINTVGPRGNIHQVIVYNAKSELVAESSSIRYGSDFPELNPSPVLKLDPRPTLRAGTGTDGYIRKDKMLIYYRIEPIVSLENRQTGALVVARHGYRLLAGVEERRNRIFQTTSVLVLLLSTFILLLVRRSVTRPINELIQRISEIGKGKWNQRIEISGRDEVASLAKEFNLMCETLQESYARLVAEQQQKIKLEQDLRHTERLASVGRLAAGVAHEIGTPLNIIGGRAEYLLRRARTPEELNDNLRTIHSQIDRIARIVRQLLEFSRRREPVFRPVDIALLLNNVRKFVDHKIDERKAHVEIRTAGELPLVAADPDLLQQVFINLFLNSLDAMESGGTIKIGAETTPSWIPGMPSGNNGKVLCITFEDNGSGISPENIAQVFDPFFTTKDIGEGTGLGLSVSYGIIKDHGGEIRVESKPGQFTRFAIYLPMEQPDKTSDSREILHDFRF
jgi:two-component system NtrC family sensor kinase